MNQNLEVAKKLFAEGISVNAVASALGISWYYAKKFKKASPLLLALHLKQSRLQYRMGRRLKTLHRWTIQVPVDRVDDILLSFTPTEKVEALRSVLQARIDALFTPPEAESETAR